MNIYAQNNWIIIIINYNNYFKLFIKLISLAIILLYLSEFILIFVVLFIANNQYETIKKLSIVQGEKRIYLFIKINDMWLNAELESLQFFWFGAFLTVKSSAKRYTYSLFSYNIPKDIYTTLSKNLCYCMLYNQIQNK